MFVYADKKLKMFGNKMSKENQCLDALKQAKKIMDNQEQEIATLRPYKEKLELAVEKLKKQQELINKLRNTSLQYGTVIGYDKRTFIVGMDQETGNKFVDEKLKEPIKTVKIIFNGNPLEVIDNPELDLKPGDIVKLITTDDGIAIAEKSEFEGNFGPMVDVMEVIDEERVSVNLNGSPRIVFTCGHKVEVETRVVLDEYNIKVLRVEKEDKKRFIHTEATGVKWEDIGGQSKAKREIVEAIEGPMRNPALYKAYNKKPAKGILLYGPPGNGKTMFGKAIATSVQAMYGSDAEGFISVKGPEILNMYVGNSEAAIRNLFEMARKFKEKHGAPAVLFIDEAEAILSKRGSSRSSDVDKTIVPQFLSEMDGLSDSAAIVVLTTNRPDMLDPAVIREGRIDKKIRIDKPDMEGVEAIFNLNLKNVPLQGECSQIVKKATQLVFDSSLVLYEINLKKGGQRQFTYSDIINGGMIASIVDEAITQAINRDLESKAEKPLGVTEDLVTKAILKSFEQNIGMNHEHHLEDLNYELALHSEDGIKEYKPVKANINVRKEESLT